MAGRKLSDGDNKSSVHGAAPKGISPSSFSFFKAILLTAAWKWFNFPKDTLGCNFRFHVRFVVSPAVL